MSEKTPLSAASSSTLTSYSVISPRTSTSICWATSPASAGEDTAELLGQRDAGADVLGDHAALDVDRVGHQLTGEREPDRPGHRDAGLLLGLVGGGAEVGGGDDVLELEQRAVGARLGGEDVEPGAGDPAGLEGVVQRLLVDDATAGGVDQDEARLGAAQLVGPDQADRLGGLGEVDGHEVGLGEQGVEVDQPHAHLRGAAGLDVGVEGDRRSSRTRSAAARRERRSGRGRRCRRSSRRARCRCTSSASTRRSSARRGPARGDGRRPASGPPPARRPRRCWRWAR